MREEHLLVALAPCRRRLRVAQRRGAGRPNAWYPPWPNAWYPPRPDAWYPPPPLPPTHIRESTKLELSRLTELTAPLDPLSLSHAHSESLARAIAPKFSLGSRFRATREQLERFSKDFVLNDTAGIWPGLSYMGHIRSTAATLSTSVK